MFGLFAEFLNSVWQRSLIILKQPFRTGEMLWILIPLLATLVLMELYFGHHKKESIGWNSAVSNSLILFFVGMNLLAYLQRNSLLLRFSQVTSADFSIAVIKTAIALVITAESIAILLINFFHLTTRKFAFGISSTLIMNYLGIISIILVYSNIMFDWMTLFSTLFIFALVVCFFKILRTVIPEAKSKYLFYIRPPKPSKVDLPTAELKE